ncbi:MAG TPA: hypothetical protein VM733_06435 [Thermoanaerobaculia bacterium]|nr:hypothetical protein [Thermoanaerobaculia bacterium]
MPDDSLITRYLLGELPPDEQNELERRYFAETTLLDRIDAAEDELIDDYVRGGLTAEQRKHFETRFLTPQRVERVRMAEALRRATRPRRNVWMVPLAASLFLALLATVLWPALRAPRRDETPVVEHRPARTTPVVPPPVVNENAPPPPPPAMQIATLVLSPGLTRSDSEVPVLALDSSIDAVRLEAMLQSEASLCDVTLQRIDGPIVWSANGVRVRRAGGEPRLVLTIPRDRFRRGQHLLTVTATDLVADYSFEVR